MKLAQVRHTVIKPIQINHNISIKYLEKILCKILFHTFGFKLAFLTCQNITFKSKYFFDWAKLLFLFFQNLWRYFNESNYFFFHILKLPQNQNLLLRQIWFLWKLNYQQEDHNSSSSDNNSNSKNHNNCSNNKETLAKPPSPPPRFI